MFSRVIKFEDRTLIYSEENSQGKTTLMRLILHSLGFAVPFSSGVNFNEIITKITLETEKEEITLERVGSLISLYKRNEIKKFFLPADCIKLHSLVFEVEEINLLENILGAIYVDQTKGVVVLNRGEIIGNNTFTVEKFVAGLQNTDIDKWTKLINEENKKLKEYSSVLSIAKYKIENNIKNEIIDEDISAEEIKNEERRLYLKSEIAIIKNKIKEIRKIQAGNNSFLEIIESYKLYVKTENGKMIKVCSDNIVGYRDNFDLIETQLKMLNIELKLLEREYSQILVNARRQISLDIDVKDYKANIDEKLKYIDLNYSKVDSIIKDCRKNISYYKRQIKNKIESKREVIDFLEKEMRDCANKLGVLEFVEKKGIFTNKINKNSGAISYKLIISFRIAFILALKKYKEITVPLIIDSLRNVELTEENAKCILKLLNEKLKGHQIIVASVFDYIDFFDKKETIIGRLIR